MLEKNVTHLALITLFLTTSFLVFADDNIIVTADRIKSTLEGSPSDIEVFETKEIEQAHSLVELLSTESDIKLSQSGPIGANTSLFLRGSDSSHTLVIIDGITMNDPSNPNRQFDIGRLSLNNIERIEILKGSQGILYGSNAIGGVILITTKKASEKASGSALIDYGSFQTINSAINVQKKFNETSLSLGIDRLQSKGFSAANANVNPNADDDGEKRTTISSMLSQKIGVKGELVLNYRGIYDEADLDKGGGPASDDPNDSQLTEEQYLKAGYNHQWDQGDTQLFFTRATHHRTLRVVSDPSDTANQNTTSKGELNSVGINHTHYTTENLTQNINLDYQHEKDQLNNVNENTSLFLYNRFEFGPGVLNLGVRGDSNKSFGEHLTYKIAMLHNFGSHIFKLSYATGFRAPSLNQLYDPTYGNKNLTPEESQTAEFGIEVPVSSLFKYSGAIFYTELTNRFSYDPVTFVNKNGGRAKIMGMENTISSQITTELNTSLSTTWLEAKDTTLNQRLARRPSFNVKLALNYKKEAHAIGLEGDYTGKRPDVDNLGNTVNIGPHLVFNMNYNFDITQKFSTYLRIKNILDKDYEDVWGYGTGGRAATLGIKYLF